METPVFDGKRNLIGKLVESGNQIRAFDKNGNLKGYYDKNTNRTMDARNALFGTGDRSQALIG